MSCSCDGDFLSAFKGYHGHTECQSPPSEEAETLPSDRLKHPVVEGESKTDRKKRLASEAQKRRYEERKAKGLCPNCGRDRENKDQWLCDSCHQKRKKHDGDKVEYLRRKTEGICTKCGKSPAVDKRTFCGDCAEKQRIRKRLTTEERKPKRVRKTQAQRLAAAKAKGFCTGCQKRPAVDGKASCETCRERAKQRTLDRKAKKLCTGCGEPALEGKLRCQVCKDRDNARDNVRAARLKQEAFAAYGGAFCACCGEDHPAFLQLDHVNNDGAARRKAGEDGLGVTLYGQLKARGWPPGYQVLCAGCNWAKDKNGGVCPHQTERLSVEVSVDYHPIDLSDWS